MIAAAKLINEVCAVVVTFNPDPEFVEILRDLRGQVGLLIVVDNATTNQEIVRVGVEATDCRLIANDRNLGIAEAMNQAARVAVEEGYSWLATFDQDSRVPTDAIANMLKCYEEVAEPARLAVLGMSHRDRNTGREYHRTTTVLSESPTYRLVRGTITSGSMVRTETFSLAGFFDADLFIDMVDHDFCLRCRLHGYDVAECTTVVLDHRIGDSRIVSFLGYRFALSRHSSIRRYFIMRNTLEVCRRYCWFDPVWVVTTLLHLGASSIAAAILEEARMSKTKAMLSGVIDFLARRFGPGPAAEKI